MALSHFTAALMTLIFGSLEWALVRYFVLMTYNFYVTHYPQWAGMPHIAFMLAFTHWGIFLLVVAPTAIYLWTQTQRPEVGQ